MRDSRLVALIFAAQAAAGAGCGPDHTQAWPDGESRYGGGGGGGVGGGECELHFDEPALGQNSNWVIGGSDVCGPTVSLDVGVTSTAESVTLFVNESPQTRPVWELRARFEDVVLGNSGDEPNRLRAEATLPDGTQCSAELQATLLVDCVRPSCALVGPSQAEPLAQADDLDAAKAGLQVDFAVQTEPENQGHPVQLFVDGDIGGARSANPDAEGLARFAGVTLPEGLGRQVQAECRDAAGNTTRSSVSELDVDITVCDVALVSVAEGVPVIAPRDDLDALEAGLQVRVQGLVVGDTCSAVRVGPCSDLPPFSELGPTVNGVFELRATLPEQDDSFDLCIQAKDSAGNQVERQRSLSVRVSAPELAILSPVDGVAINQQGDATHVGDLQPASGTCEATFQVRCSEPGATIELFEAAAAQPFAGGEALCEAGVDGLAAQFAAVSLPTRDDGTAVSVVARQESVGLLGESPAIEVYPDCVAPELTWTELACPLVSVTSTDADTNPGQPGVQLRAVLSNPSLPTPSVQAFFTKVGEAPGAALSSTGDAFAPEFELELELLGTDQRYALSACASDASGNRGCAEPCEVHANDGPAVLISTPTDGAVLGSGASDCDEQRAGFDLLVAGYATAPEGNAVSLTLGDGPAQSVLLNADAGQNFSACIPAEQGLDQLLRVEVTDADRPGRVGRATAQVSIDTLPPSGGLALSVLSVPGRRAGQVVLGWTAVADAGGQPLAAYALRCADTDITDELGWEAATDRPLSLLPGAPGEPQQVVLGFPLLEPSYCALRATDAGGFLTPLAETVQIALDFESFTLSATPPRAGASYPRKGAVPLGDVTGNAGNDFLYAGVGSAVELFEGVPLGQSGRPQVVTRFVPAQAGDGSALAPNLGVSLAGLGDINGDGRNDFALAAGGLEGGDDGAVFLIYGRDQWPPSLELGGGTCLADVCLDPPADGLAGVFGYDLTAGDFDGDGENDLLLGHPFSNGFRGEAYAVRGGPASGLDRPVLDDLGTDEGLRVRVSDSSLSGFVFTVPAAWPEDMFGLGSSLTMPTPGQLVLGAYDGAAPTYVLLTEGRAYDAQAGMQAIDLVSDFITLRRGAPLEYGTTVRAAGDVNGDGQLDLLSFLSSSADGRVELFLNLSDAGSSAPLAPVVLRNSQLATGRFFGRFLAEGYSAALGPNFVLSNLDGDSAGTSEVVAGAVGKFGDAAVFVGPIPQNLDAAAPGAAARMYDSLTQQAMIPNFVGDVTGDGFPDLLLVDYDNWDATSPASDGGSGEDPPQVELRLLY